MLWRHDASCFFFFRSVVAACHVFFPSSSSPLFIFQSCYRPPAVERRSRPVRPRATTLPPAHTWFSEREEGCRCCFRPPLARLSARPPQ